MQSSAEADKLQATLTEKLSESKAKNKKLIKDKKRLEHDVRVYRNALKQESYYQTEQAKQAAKKSFKDKITLVNASLVGITINGLCVLINTVHEFGFFVWLWNKLSALLNKLYSYICYLI